MICQGTDKTVTLYAKGSTLENSKTTDQDGLNTCGANALALALRSSLKTKEDISYLDVAIQGAQNKWNKLSPFEKKMIDEDRMVFEGTPNVCETFQSVKDSGGACSQTYFSFEQTIYSNWKGRDTGDKQAALLKALSQFMDIHTQNQTLSGKRKKDLQSVLQLIQNKKLTFVDKCKAQGDGQDKVEFRKTFQNLMGKTMLWLSSNRNNTAQSACLKATRTYFNQFVKTPLSPTADQHPLDVRDEIIAKFRASYDEAHLFEDYKKGLQPPPEKFSLAVAHFMDSLSNASVKGKSLSSECLLAEPTSDHPLSGAKLYKPELTKDVLAELRASLSTSECEKTKLMDWLNSKAGLKEAEAVCEEDSGLKDLLKALNVMQIWNGDHNSIIIEGRGQPDQLTKILAPHCAKNRRSLGDLDCREFSAFTRMQPLPLEDLRRNFRNVAGDQLDQGRAIPIGICDSFLKENTTDTIDTCQYNQTGYHAVAITGYRCVKGKVEYEMANSWGQHCPIKKGTKDENLECITDIQGFPTGRYWIQEDRLLKNLDKYWQIQPEVKK